MNRGISLTELLHAPGWLVQDFIYLAAEFSKAQRRADKRKELEKELNRRVYRPSAARPRH